jgi:hypothetical protein
MEKVCCSSSSRLLSSWRKWSWPGHHLGHHQLLVRKESGLGAAGNGEEAAPIPLVLAALLLLEPLQPLLPSILL